MTDDLRTKAATRLLDHIERLDYDVYDAARSFLVDEIGHEPTGTEWEDVLRLIEQEAIDNLTVGA